MLLGTVIFERLFDFHWQYTGVALLALVPAVLNWLIALYVIRRLPRGSAAFVFALFVGALACWQTGDGLMRLSATRETALAWWSVWGVFPIFSFPLGMHFALLFTERKRWLRSYLYTLVYLPAVLVLFLRLSGTLQPRFILDPVWGWRVLGPPKDVGMLKVFLAIWSLGTLVGFCLLLFWYAWKSRISSPKKRKQALLIALGLTVPFVFHILVRVWLGHPSKGPSPLGSTIMSMFSIATFVALVRYELFQVSTQVLSKALLQVASDAILVAMPTGRLQYINPTGERFFGITADDMGRHGVELIFGEDQASFGGFRERVWGPVLEGQTVTDFEANLRLEGGRSLPVLMSAAPVPVERQTLPAVLLVIHDISHLKEAELALVAAKEEADLARDDAERANKVKSQFLANMSHELRTPLNAIIGYAEMLQEEVGELGVQELAPDLQHIHRAGRHLLGLINDILDISKIEAGRFELHPTPFSLSQLVDEVQFTVQPLAEKNGNTLHVVVEQEEGTHMLADEMRVRQILLNLLSNACKFTHQGRVSLRVQQLSGGDVCFEVQDTGVGMTQAQMELLFEPFVQLDNVGRKGKQEGTGLGLAITRRLCEMMGGTMEVRSQAGEGSTFSMTLPLRALPQVPLRRTGEAKAFSTKPEETPLILVIDDDWSVRDLMNRSLTKEGFQVITAATGEEGLLLAEQYKPRSILLDIFLPGISGWEVLSELQASPGLADIPVIVLSISDDKKKGLMLGASEYLTKPAEQEEIVRMLRRFQRVDEEHTVLLVDDDADNRALLRKTLHKIGWQTIEAADGDEALVLLEEHHPDLMLLDLMMPKKDGFEVLDVMRSESKWAELPVVVLTAKHLDTSEQELLRLQTSRVVTKGEFSLSELALQLQRTLVSS